jgi:hypothetical protein
MACLDLPASAARGRHGRTASVRAGPQQGAVATGSGFGLQQDAAAAARSVEHTPVSGRTSSTRRAASTSPARCAAMDRTCSCPVAIRKVGARP